MVSIIATVLYKNRVLRMTFYRTFFLCRLLHLWQQALQNAMYAPSELLETPYTLCILSKRGSQAEEHGTRYGKEQKRDLRKEIKNEFVGAGCLKCFLWRRLECSYYGDESHSNILRYSGNLCGYRKVSH